MKHRTRFFTALRSGQNDSSNNTCLNATQYKTSRRKNPLTATGGGAIFLKIKDNYLSGL
jgi:hypothetical protein